jgi:hypothetical protein
MSCTNPFDKHLKDAAKREEDLLKRTVPVEEYLADKAIIDKMKMELQKLRDKQA